MTQEVEDLTFISYYRRQFPLQINPDANKSHLSGTINLTVKGGKIASSFSKDEQVSVPVTYYGPGDIEGINPSAIARIEPPPGTHDFEPNYFPFIEFRDPDFLWRYSLDINQSGGNQQQPWLMLLALTSAELRELSQEQAAFRQKESGGWQLTLEKRFLPSADPGQAIRWDWATAHVQLNSFPPMDPTDSQKVEKLQKFIADHPSQNCCRLFCLRKLTKKTNYTLFLVPYYLAGAQEVDNKSSVLDTTQDTITLPVYYHSQFATDEIGDFEFLARRLQPKKLPKGSGVSLVDAKLESVPERIKTIPREGALAAPGFTRKRILYKKQIQNQWNINNAAEELLLHFNKAIPGPQSTNLNEDPLVILPYYGKHYQNIERARVQNWRSGSTLNSWTIELNFDFRNRISAGFGTSVIQKKQDEYLKQCWLQVGDLRLANEKLKKAQTALAISQSLSNRFLSKLSDQKFIIATRPFHTNFVYQDEGESVSLKKRLDESGLSRGITHPAFLKICRQKIPRKPLRVLASWQATTPVSTLTPESSRLTPDPDFEQRAKKYAHMTLPPGRNVGLVPQLKKEIIQVKPIGHLKMQFRDKFDVSKTLLTKMEEMIHFINPEKRISETFDPILVVPLVKESMYRPLKTLSLDYILPGIDKLPMNSMTVCEENRYFIEAFLCGCNDEMGKELLWNQFPFDQQGTIFYHFWDPATTEGEGQKDELGQPQPLRDILPFKTFSTLGHNFPNIQNAQSTEGRLVLLIKGDLIRRYPDTIIFALKGGNIIAPDFRAQLGVDILVIGFPFTDRQVRAVEDNPRDSYYFVLQQQQELPHFGVDVPSETDPAASDPARPIEYFSPSDLAPDSENAAQVAKARLQHPIQLKIHSSRMIKREA